MKVLLVTPLPPDRVAPGAIPALLHAAVVGLAETNDLTVLTAAGPDADELASLERIRGEGFAVEAVERHRGPDRWRRRARMAGAWAAGRDPWRTIWFREPTLQPKLDVLLDEGGFDVVSIEDNAMGTYELDGRTPTVITEYEVRRPRPMRWRPGGVRRWPAWAFEEADWRRWHRYQDRVWSRFDAVQVFTQRDAETAASVVPAVSSRLHVNPFAIELPRLESGPPVDDGTIAFLGNFSHPPNVDAARWLACEVLPHVRAAVPGARLRIAGVQAPPSVLALAGPDVEVVGYVADADDFLRRAAVVAAPVRIGGGMRMKVLHAMALGKAVVTTSRGVEGLHEPRGDVAALADDAPSLAGAIAALLRNPRERESLGARARALVEDHHSPAAYARRAEAVYADAIDRHRARHR